MLLHSTDILLRDDYTVMPAYARLFIQSEIYAICIIDKCEPAIGGETADKFGLVFDNIPLPLFTLF